MMISYSAERLGLRKQLEWIVSFLPNVVPPCQCVLYRSLEDKCPCVKAGLTLVTGPAIERAADPKRGEPRLAGSEC